MIKVFTEHFLNGKIKYKHYRLNDNLHNPDGPARIWYRENGSIECEEYYLNGNPHYENGPAKIWYYENGNIKSKQYWINSNYLIDVNSIEQLQKYIKLNNIT